MIQPPSLQLRDIALSRNDAGKLAFTAQGDLIRGGTPVTGAPPFRLGVGQSVVVPPAVTAALAEHDITVQQADFGLWLQTVNEAVTDPVWYGAFTTAGIDLFGAHTLGTNALTLPAGSSLALADLQLRIALQVRGMAVQRALVVVAGRLQNDLRLGPLAVDGLDARFALHLDIADLASLSAILDDPEALLDAAFTGRLAFQVDGTKLAIVDDSLLAIDDATLQFFVAVSSPAGERTLTLGDVVFGLGAAQLTLAGATIENLDLTGRYDAAQQRVSLQGSADTRLPSLLDPVLDSTHPSTGTAIRSAFEFEHRPGSTTLDLALDHLYLDPAVNLLELSARDLQLGFRHQNGAWQLKLGGTTCQSWSRLARRMAEAGILRLPRGDDLPDLAGKLDFALSDGGSAFRYRLDMLMPGTGCREGVVPIPFVGPLGPLPVELADSYLAVEFAVDGHGAFHWSFSGGGTLSTTGWLRDPLPLDGLTFGVQARGADDAIPELILTIDGGLPPLRLPPLFPGAGPIEFFQPQTLAVRVGETFAIDGTAAIPNPADIVDELGLPAEWRSLFQPISDLLTGMQASLVVRLPLAGDGPATLGLTLEPVNAPRFRLMEALGAVIAAGQSGQFDDSQQIKADDGHEFFEAQPGRIEFLAAFADSLSLSLSLSFDCRVFGETFDLTALLRLVDGEPEFLLMAGLLDPIRLAIPGIKPEDVLGAVDVRQLVQDYHLDQHLANPPFPGFHDLFPYASGGDATDALHELERLFRDLFAGPGVDTSLIFEIRNLGLRVRLDQAPSISGTVRLVQLPGFLDLMMPEQGFDFGLGCSTQRVFISVKGPGADDPGLFESHTTAPLFSVPLGQDGQGRNRWVHLYFGRFELEYSWVTHAFGFLLDAAVVPEPADLGDFNLLGSGIYIPAQKTFVKLSKQVATGKFPIIIPEWAISFKREGIGTEVVETAADEMGLQYYLGNPLDTDERFATLYFRETRFSPTYYLMQPGLTVDGGFIVGPHRPLDYRYDSPSVLPPRRYDDLFEELTAGPGDKLVAHVEINNWQFILIPGSLGLLLNPLAVLAPGSPMPPFWVSPLHLLMGDVFADRIGLSVNLPHLLFFGLSFSRPLPALSLQGMMELAALAMTGFSETIPPSSALREVYYATLEINAQLPLLTSLIGNTPAFRIDLEANIVDVVNGIIQLSQAVQETIQDGQALVDRLQADPSLLVRLIPAQARRFELDVSHDLLRFRLHGSLYVLTPDEFKEELVLYHENKCSRRGLAASNPHPPAAPTGAAVNDQPLQLVVTAEEPFQFIANPLDYFDPAEKPFQAYLGAGARRAAKHRQTSYRPLDALRRERDAAVTRFADLIWNALRETTIADHQGRRAILQQHGLDTVATRLEGLVAGAMGLLPAGLRGSLPPTPVRQLPPAILNPIRAQVVQLVRGALTRPYTLIDGLNRSPSALAAAIVADTVHDRPVGISLPLTAAVVRPLVTDGLVDLPVGPEVPGATDPGSGVVADLIIALAANPATGPAPLGVQFVGQYGLNIQSVTWNFGDGSTGSGLHPLHTYQNPGTYTATATATNTAGTSQSRSVSVTVQASAPASQPVSVVTIAGWPERAASYQTHLPKALIREVVDAIEACFAPWIAQVDAGQIDTPVKATTLRLALAECIAAAIAGRFPVTTADLEDTTALDLSPREIRAKLLDALATTPLYQDGVRRWTLFDGQRTRDLLVDHVAAARQPGPVIDSVPEVRYEIRARPEFVPAGETATLAVVPTSTPIYRVVRHAGRYELLVEGNDDGDDERVALPGWVTGGIPASPRATDLIRARLHVEQVIVHRPLTDAERTYTNHAFVEQDDRLYQQSILARPEYAIRPTGGRHGPLSIADLLANDQGYLVPPAPLWLSGLKLDLPDSVSIGMVGLLAPPDTIFLNGYHELQLGWGKAELALAGEFHLIAGDLWEQALAGDGVFQANSLHFHGSAEFRFDGRSVFRGQARGTIRVPAPDEYNPPVHSPLPTFHLRVAVEYHDSWTLEFDQLKLIKVTMDAGFDIEVEFDPNNTAAQFALRAEGDLGLTAQFALPALKEVVITPETTVCAQVPIVPPRIEPPYWRTECVTLPPVTLQVPDLTDVEWHSMGLTTDPELALVVGDSGNRLAITLAVSAGAVIAGTPVNVSSQIELSNLIN